MINELHLHSLRHPYSINLVKSNNLLIGIAIYYFSRIFRRSVRNISSTNTVRKLDAQLEKTRLFRSFNKTPWRMSVHNKHLAPFQGQVHPRRTRVQRHPTRAVSGGGVGKKGGGCDPPQDLRTWTFSAYRDKSVILHA